MFVRGILLFLVAVMPLALQAQTPSKQDECLLTQPGVCARHVLGDEIGILTSPLHVRTKDLSVACAFWCCDRRGSPL